MHDTDHFMVILIVKRLPKRHNNNGLRIIMIDVVRRNSHKERDSLSERRVRKPLSLRGELAGVHVLVCGKCTPVAK